MTDLYSELESEKLIRYYSPFLIGRVIEESTQAIIFNITTIEEGKNLFRVVAQAKYQGSVLVRSIFKVAEFHHLTTPKSILRGLSQ